MRVNSSLAPVALPLWVAKARQKRSSICRSSTTPNTRPMPKTACNQETEGSARMLTGKKLTSDEIAALEAKKKERDARCKPQADHLADLQRQITAAQQ